ncbi:patatin-like phospholipase family protein [Aerococcaceae bacterium zg-BR22]|uniref:patatin-like phospholipase family protein n=1 Tax=Aerococcaceae bacterium zg-1292 TaxID=2774330 RepID=UPI004063754E|nr:patatin-like phospholipase family protein [Aerococcaceae bacterium zg-BR22]
MKIGLVLEGGGMRGMYTAGVLDVLLQAGVKVDGIVSVSAGALFGVNYLSNQPGRAIRYNKRFATQRNYIGWYSLLTTGNIVNQQFAYYDVPFELDVFDEATFAASATPFIAVVTNVETGQAEYKMITHPLKQMEILRATSALPYVSKFVMLDGIPYLDGGIVDSIPVAFAQTLGFDKLIIVLTRPNGYRKEEKSNKLAKRFYRHYPQLVDALENRNKRYNATLEQIANDEAAKRLLTIRPSEALKVKRIERNPQRLQAMYDLGVKDGETSLINILDYLSG